MDVSSQIPTKLLWLDLEMTGLNLDEDLILEVAVEASDFNFKTLGTYEARVKHDRAEVERLLNNNTFYSQQFTANRDDFLGKLDQANESNVVEDQLVSFVKEHFRDEPAVLAGNSIHNDRNFIKKHWPKFDQTLHYRMLDVSAWKIVMQAKYGVNFEKKQMHQAFDDIQASIAELQFYLDWFNKQPSPQT
ncbi:MAG TPA: oligoribonuclease [Candidatus Saccharimonadales bacterium]|nr:oligoribonuclease [Candidatus Saccharimonadales bacterium]